jgi:DNA-binding FadR family transcriptional regulator
MRTLLADIARGAPAPGGTALREADIADQFGVSRGVARECVRSLEERGVVSVKPGRGATVNPHEHWAALDPDVVGALLTAERSGEFLDEYLECRRILELEAVRLAAERALAQDMAALSDALALMGASAQRAAFNPAAQHLCDDAEAGFHRALNAATHNRALGALLTPLHRALSGAPPAPAWGRAVERSLASPRRIVTAIADHDSEAARAAMRDHLDDVERRLRERAGALAHRRDGEPQRADATAPDRDRAGATARDRDRAGATAPDRDRDRAGAMVSRRDGEHDGAAANRDGRDAERDGA